MRTVLFLIPLLLACQPPAAKQTVVESNNLQGSSAEIKLLDLQGTSLSKKEGKILILNLWATWCKPCIEEMPALERMAKQLPDQFEVILASEEDLNRINAFVSARSLALTFAQLESGLDGLGVYSLPTTLIIGPDGQTIETIVGARAWDSPEQINHLLSLTK